MSRISSNRGGPKDLLLISNGFLYINDIYQDLTKPKKYKSKPSLLKNIIQSFSIDYNLFFEIQKAFKINVPLLAKEGGFIKDGFNEKLDHLRNLRNNEYNQIVELQKKYSHISKINSLKIKHNKVLGYHIEVRAMHDASLRNLEQFIHRQSTAQTSRFTTVELNEIEIQIASSSFKAIEIELEIFTTWFSMFLFLLFYFLTITTDMFIGITVCMFLMGYTWGEKRMWVNLSNAIITPGLIFILFDYVLRIRFPRGILTNIYYG